MWLERTVELDCVNMGDALGEELGEDAQAGSDFEHDVVLVELRKPAGDPEDVFVYEEVLAELAVRDDWDAGHRPRAGTPLRRSRRSLVRERPAPRPSPRRARRACGRHAPARCSDRVPAAERGTGCRSRR